MRLCALTLVVLVMGSFSGLELQGACFIRGRVHDRQSITIRQSVNVVNITDAILILKYLFSGAPLSCKDAADVDDDGEIGLADAIFLLRYLFLDRPPPLPPFPFGGGDPTDDGLDCKGPECEGGGLILLVIDRSGSMADGDLNIAKREAKKELESLSACDHFVLIFFDYGTLIFPVIRIPSPATQANLAAGKAFLVSIQPGHDTCPKIGLMAALDLAECSGASRKTIIYYSDGDTTCPGQDTTLYASQTLAAVRERNQGKVTIRTVGVGTEMNPAFLEALAAQNNGTFEQVPQ